jgi:hypothetical protein
MPKVACSRVRSESCITYVTVSDASDRRRMFGSAPADLVQSAAKCICDTDENNESWWDV